MYLFIFFLSTLPFYVFFDGILIPLHSYCIHIKPFRPKLSSPQFLLYFWMFLKYLSCNYTFYRLNYSRWTFHRNTLYQKMNMVCISPYFNKYNFISLRYFNTNCLQSPINRITENNLAVFGGTYIMIKQNRYIMTLMNIIAHITIVLKEIEAELRGIKPK